MTLTLFIFLCLAGAVLLFGLELLLPSHGILGVLAAATLLTGVGACFWVDRWLGLGVLVATLALAPMVFTGAMRIWPRTPIGKRMVLPPIDGSVARPPVAVGQTGIAVSELRPGGTADFNGERVEVICEHGIIPPRTGVRVVSFENNRPIVERC
jgi:membrane-bound ClpP family serine protease